MARKYTFLFLLFSLSCLFVACDKDDDMPPAAECPIPENPTELSTCLMEIPDQLRPENAPDVRFKVDLYLSGEDYYYAFVSSSISTPVEVYDACCNYICRIGFPITEECSWRDSAEELGTIWEE